jgi:hypothetical protein
VSLRKHDQLYLIAYDESWVVPQALVSEADSDGATLANTKLAQTPQRARTLFRDSNYAIVWNGVGWHVERLKDGHRMTGTVLSVELAERDLRNCYPKPVTGGLQ